MIKEGQLVSIAEKRLAIDLVGIIDLVCSQGEERDRRECLKWIPTYLMWADHLTKIRPSHELREILGKRFLRLRQTVPLKNSAGAGKRAHLKSPQ